MPEDPTKALQAAVEALTQQISENTKALGAMEETTLGGKNAAEQRVSQGKRARAFDSSGDANQQIIEHLAAISGKLGEDASALGPETFVGEQRNRAEQEGRARQGAETKYQALKGLSEATVRKAENEPLTVPQYQWRLDEQLRVSRDMAVKTAGWSERRNMNRYQGQLRQQGEREGLNPEEAQEYASNASYSELSPTIGGKVAGGVAKALNFGYENAALFEGVKGVLGKLAGNALAASATGAQLGYSPQSGIGGAYIMGLPNPLAALTSQAGKQGLGMQLSSLGAMFSGGISYQQAQGLREGLAGEGFSNQKQGMWGMYTEGEQESLAEALEPSVKEGMSPNVAASFGNVTRLGNTSVKELKESLKGLGGTAKTLKKTIDQTAESMQKYAEQMEQAGSTKLEGMEHYKEVAGATGINPEKVAAINESQLGTAMGQRAGYFPGTVGAQAGTAQAGVASSTIQEAKNLIHGEAKKVRNPLTGEMEEVSAEEDQAQKIAAVFHIPKEEVLAFSRNKEKIAAGVRALNLNKANEAAAQAETQHRMLYFEETHPYKLAQRGKLEKQLESQKEQHQNEKEKWEKEHGGTEFRPGHGAHLKVEENDIESTENKLKKLHKEFENAKSTKSDKATEQKRWGSEWMPAHQLGITQHEFNQIFKEGKSWEDRRQKLKTKEGEKETIAQGESEGKGFIDLTPQAKQFFKLHYPKQWEEGSRAGGESTAQRAAQPSQGNQPNWEAYEKQLIQKAEATENK